MYRYEDYSLEALLNSPDLDPADPEVLYAIAQCYRQGRGVEKDETSALAVLREAAAAGSEQARQELGEMGCGQKARTQERTDYRAMSLGELSRLANEENDLRACLVLYENSVKWNDPAAAESYLRQCLDGTAENFRDMDFKCEVLEDGGTFYEKRDPEKSRHYYELARELGSLRACRALAGYYQNGIGGAAEPELAMDCLRQLEERGTPEDVYQCMLTHIKAGRRSRAHILLEKLLESADAVLRLKALLAIHDMDPQETPWEKLLSELWDQRESKTAQRSLLEAYKEQPELPVTGEQAMWLAERQKQAEDQQSRIHWLRRAEELGVEEAATIWKNLEAEMARKAAEEADRRRREEEEAARRAAEEAERRRREEEEAARRAAEEAERRRREEEEAARRAAEETERRRREEQELKERAEANDPEALLKLGNLCCATAGGMETSEEAENLRRAKAYWLRGAELDSGMCCLRFAEVAYLIEKNYRYAVNMAQNAMRLAPDTAGRANQIIEGAKNALQAEERKCRSQQEMGELYAADTARKLKPQLILVALGLVEVVLILAGRGGILNLEGMRYFEKVALTAVTACTMRALIRFFSIRKQDDWTDHQKQYAEERMRGPLQRQLGLTVLCGITRAILGKSLVDLFVPYYYGIFLAAVIKVVSLFYPLYREGWIAAALNFALGRPYRWPLNRKA